jgi:hypothetical protein
MRKMRKNGYYIFAMAPSAIGKLTTIRQLVEHEASRQDIPFDYCYVNNFSQPAKPTAVKFMPGQGKIFKHDMAQLIDELSVAYLRRSTVTNTGPGPASLRANRGSGK